MMSSQTVGRPMEILLVEDSLVDARLTIAALTRGQIQHRMTLIRDGEEAMEFLRRESKFARAPRPDLILLDLLMPKKTGLELLAEVREDEQLKRIPIVILTSSEAEEDRLRCEMLNVDSYIIKPVDTDKFLQVVKDLRRYWLKDVILP